MNFIIKPLKLKKLDCKAYFLGDKLNIWRETLLGKKFHDFVRVWCTWEESKTPRCSTPQSWWEWSAQRRPLRTFQCGGGTPFRLLDEIGSASVRHPKRPSDANSGPDRRSAQPGRAAVGSRHRESWTGGSQTVAARCYEILPTWSKQLWSPAEWWQLGGLLRRAGAGAGTTGSCSIPNVDHWLDARQHGAD